MTIFLTGGTGFIGQSFLKHALKKNYKIYALRRTNNSNIIHPNLTWIDGDLNNFDIDTIKDCNTLIHLASHSTNHPYDSIINCIQYNVLDTLNFLQVLYENNFENFFISGTGFEYGLSANNYDKIPVDAKLQPIGTYPTSKALLSIALKEWVKKRKVKFIYGRFFHVYGDGEFQKRLWPSLKLAAQNGNDFKMTKGDQIRDFIEVNELSSIIIKSIKFNYINYSEIKYQNFGSGHSISVKEFAEFWWKKFNAKGKLIFSLPHREGEIMNFIPKL